MKRVNGVRCSAIPDARSLGVCGWGSFLDECARDFVNVHRGNLGILLRAPAKRGTFWLNFPGCSIVTDGNTTQR